MFIVKKILFIAPGNSTHSLKWITYFKKKCKIYWISGNNFNLKVDFAEFYNFGDNYLSLILSPFNLLIKTIVIKPDIIHVHSISKNLYASLLIILFFKKKIIFTPWGSDIYFPNLFVKIIQNIFLKNTKFIVDSFLLEKKIKLISKNNVVSKINFGIDCNFFNEKKFDKKLFANKKIIFCPRGYEEIYNNILILKMIHRIRLKINNYIFVFVGRAGINKKKTIKIAQNLQISKFCLFLSHINKKKLLYFYNISEFVISASKSDAGISSSIAEAMSCKKIVLITNNRDNPFWIKSGFNGFLFKNNDLNDLAREFLKIKNLTNSIKFMIGNNARKIQLANNNYASEMSKVNKIYNSID